MMKLPNDIIAFFIIISYHYHSLSDSTSYMGSNVDTVSEAYHYDPHTRKLDIDSKAAPKEFKSTDDHVVYLQKWYLIYFKIFFFYSVVRALCFYY